MRKMLSPSANVEPGSAERLRLLSMQNCTREVRNRQGVMSKPQLYESILCYQRWGIAFRDLLEVNYKLKSYENRQDWSSTCGPANALKSL
jgi:hypothetical protein